MSRQSSVTRRSIDSGKRHTAPPFRHSQLTVLLGFLVFAISCCGTGRLCAQDDSQGPQPPEGVTYDRDIEYGKGGGEPLHLDLARPAQRDKPAPCIVVIHGGGWAAGNKSHHTDLIFQLASRGYVAATVQYRFAPDHPFPAQVEDVKCAVRYLRAHADEYGIDAKRIGAMGFSAGAHLSMMLGSMGADDGLEGEGGWPDQSSKVQAVVSFAGPTDLAADDLPPPALGPVKGLLGGSASEKPDLAEKASPLTYASEGDAPMLLLHGTKDNIVPYSQAVKMAEALTEAGVPGRIELILGAGHGWGGADAKRSMEQTFEFFDRYLTPDP